jgi:hypothetical protein
MYPSNFEERHLGGAIAQRREGARSWHLLLRPWRLLSRRRDTKTNVVQSAALRRSARAPRARSRAACAARLLLLATTAVSAAAHAEEPPALGFKVSAGGRYDDVRLCVVTGQGVKGGPAGDISFVAEFGSVKNVLFSLDVPVFRPILFATSFDMLQFEPDVTAKFIYPKQEKLAFVVGPSLGFSLHYGPDYQSSAHGSGRGPSFFAMGPRVGGYFGLDFKRPQQTFNFQLGLHPYVTPLFGVSDPADHKGVVVGGSLDLLFRFSLLAHTGKQP